MIYKITSSSPPVMINTLADFSGIACGNSNAFYILNADIDVAAEAGSGTNNFTPICHLSPDFLGIFDGNGHTLSNLHNTSLPFDWGLFSVTGTGQISNLNIDTITTGGMSFGGGLIGDANGTDIYNVHISNATINGTSFMIGGFIGNGSIVKIYNSSFSGTVTGDNYTGGLCGRCIGGGNIAFSTSTGSVSGNDYVGGVAGGLTSADYVSSDAIATGNSNIGGIIGFATSFSDSNYFTGAVTGNTIVGGIFGYSTFQPGSSYVAGSVTVNVSDG